MKVNIKKLQDDLDSKYSLTDYKVLPKREHDVSGFYLLGDVITGTIISYITSETKYRLRNIKTNDDGKVSVFFEERD